MIDELLKVVQIDVSQGTQSVKEYTEALDKAKTSADKLNEELESVQNTTNKEAKADFLAGLSDGLDDVAKKFNGDYKPAVEALIKQMGELNNETINLTSSIDDFNGKQLKADFLEGISDGIDDVVEQFDGDYKKAVDSIIDKMKDLNEATEDLGETMEDDVKPEVKEVAKELEDVGKKGGGAFKLITNAIGLTPLQKYVEDMNRVKRILEEAGIVGAKGFNKVKLAIAGTGIGLLIVAVGTLIARFDDLKKAVGITDDTMQDFKKQGISALGSMVGAVSALGSAIVTGIVGGVKLAWNGVKNYGGLILDTFKSIGQAIMNPTEAGKIFDNYKISIKQRLSDIGKDVSNLGKSISEQWNKGMQAGQNLVTNYFAPDPDKAEAKAKEATARVKAVSDEASGSTSGSTSGSGDAQELDRSSLDNELKEIEERTKYQKQWTEALLLSEEEKKQRIFELEQQGYQERLDAYNKFMQERQLSKAEQDALEDEMEKIRNEAMVEDLAYTNERMKQLDEEEKARKEQELVEEQQKIVEDQEYESELAELTITNEQELQDRLYQIKVEALQKEEALLQKQLQDTSLSAKEREKLEKNLILTQARLNDEQRKKQEADDKAALNRKKLMSQQSLNVSSQLFGAVGQLAGKNSAVGKAMAIAQTTISTYQSATEAYKSMAGIPIVGPALGAAAAAAAIVSGIANIKEIMSTDEKGESSAPSSSAATTVEATATPSVASVSAIPEQVGVTPLLDEYRDLTNMQTLPVTGESSNRVYVVESDINEVGTRVEVRDSEATF